MRVKCRSLLMAIVMMLVFLECEFNYMLPLGILSDRESAMMLKTLLCMIAFVFYKTMCKNVVVAKEIQIIELIFMIIIPVNMMVSYTTGLTALDAFLNASHYFYVFLIEPTLYLLDDEKTKKKLIRYVLMTGCLTIGLRCYMSFYYHNNNHALLFPNLSIGAGTKERYNSIFGYNMLRVYPSCLGAVVLFGFAYIFLASKKTIQKIVSGCIVVLVYLYYFLVYQARSYAVIFGIELFILFLSKKYTTNRSVKTLVRYIAAAVALVWVLNLPVTKELFTSFQVNSELGESTSIRMVGITLVFSKILRTIPVGIGGNSVFDSVAGLIYADDYGFLDFILKNNICGVIVYVILCSYICVWLYRTRHTKWNLLMMSMSFVFLASMLSVDNFLPRKIGAFPLIIAVFEYCRQKAMFSLSNVSEDKTYAK